MQKVINFIKHPTSKHVIINTVGNYLNVAFTALFALLLVRILDPAEYGVMSVLLGIAYVLANVLDFGTTATIYSYLPNLYHTRSFGLYRFIKSTVYYQSLFAGAFIFVLIISFPFLDQFFFHTHAPTWELTLTAVSVLFLIWQNFALNTLFAAKKFIQANVFLNISNLLKTAVIFYLSFIHAITVGSIIFVFGMLGPAIFFIFLFSQKRGLVKLLLKAEVKREEFRFGYTLPFFVASQFQNLGLRMDLFLLSFFGLKMDAGYYGLAQKIILTVISTVISITQVLSPGFSNIQKKSEIPTHIKTAALYLLVPSALFAVIAFIPQSVYQFVFTPKFGPAAPIARLLAVPFIIYTLGNIPLLFILYTVRKPYHLLVANILFFLIVTGGCFYLIPIMKLHGPPLALLTAFIISTTYLVFVSLWEYKKMKTVTS